MDGAMDELVREGTVTIDGVVLNIESPDAAGWAVFAGCDGEDPRLVAMFFGRRALQGADALLAAKVDDGGEEVPAVFDGERVPALMTEHGLVAANRLEDEESIAALAKLSGLPEESWTR